jgi:hypothetical protein
MNLKNIPTPTVGAYCRCCNQMTFNTRTPSGGIYITCPICSTPCKCATYEKKHDIMYDTDYFAHYCTECNVVIDVCCTHAANGCTENCFFGALVIEYEYDGKKYKGMPQFKSLDHYISVASKMILTLQCMSTRVDPAKRNCPRAHYNSDKKRGCGKKTQLKMSTQKINV